MSISVNPELHEHMSQSTFSSFTRIETHYLNNKDNEFYLIVQVTKSEQPTVIINDEEVPDEKFVRTFKGNFAKTIILEQGLANVRKGLIKAIKSYGYGNLEQFFVIEHDMAHKGINLIRHCKDLFLENSSCIKQVKCDYNENIDTAYQGRA